MFDEACIFCKIVQGEIPSNPVMENEYVLVIPDLHPKAPIHYLVMPKKHIIDIGHLTDDDDNYSLEMVKMVTKVAQGLEDPKAFNIVSNNGAKAGQSVFHMHWHFLAGKNIYGSGFSL